MQFVFCLYYDLGCKGKKVSTTFKHELPVRIQENAQVKKYTFEFYWFIFFFKLQNGAFQVKFHEFGSRGI